MSRKEGKVTGTGGYHTKRELIEAIVTLNQDMIAEVFGSLESRDSGAIFDSVNERVNHGSRRIDTLAKALDAATSGGSPRHWTTENVDWQALSGLARGISWCVPVTEEEIAAKFAAYYAAEEDS